MDNDEKIKEYEAHKTPVPSYEEYISLVNWKEDLTELCTLKERIIEKYENTDTWWKAEYTELKEENTKLKKLLKECKGSIATLLAKRITEVNGIRQKELLAKINQALGEDK